MSGDAGKFRANGTVTLVTDFGTRDWYAGVMKGVLLSSQATAPGQPHSSRLVGQASRLTAHEVPTPLEPNTRCDDP